MEKIIKTEVREAYASIAKANNGSGCCADAACCSPNGNSMTEDYSKVDGRFEEADLALGCGIPTDIANIKNGNTVLDLGSGAGNDVFIARKLVGESGKVIGIDMTPEMVILALKNNQKLGFKNVEFFLDDIENMTSIQNETIDVVISNCVLNLVPDKKKVFSHIHRVLKTGGHFSISDIVHTGKLPKGILEAAEMYAGCVAGASEKGAYLGHIKSAGFKNIEIKKERQIELPDDLLLKYISAKELAAFRKSKSGIYSITVFAEKTESGSCCESTEEDCCGSKVEAVENSSCCGSSSTGCC